MNEAPVRDEGAVDASLSSGAMLKRAREAQGLHITALAAALKVPVAKLEALEADRYEHNTDIAFVRSLAISICRYLQIAPAPVLVGLPKLRISPAEIDIPSLNTSFKDSSEISRQNWWSRLLNPIGLLVGLLLLAIAVVLLWPPASDSQFRSKTEVQALLPGSVIEALPPALPSQPAATALAPSFLPLSEPVVPASAPSGSQAPVAGTQPVEVSEKLLQLRAHGQSWVEVLDAEGQPRLKRMMQAGEAFELAEPLPLPLSLVVARADQVTLQVRGEVVNLQSVARDNVARFEVK